MVRPYCFVTIRQADVVTKRLRPVLTGYRPAAILYALMILATGYTGKSLRAEAAGCDCVADRRNGLYKCVSRRQHAFTTFEMGEKA